MCLLEDDHPVCYCVPDFHGISCELRYDDCESKFAQCNNGGTCVDGINSFTCACPPNYGGFTCEYSFPLTTAIDVEITSSLVTSPTKISTIVETSPGEFLSTFTSVPLSSTVSADTYSTTSRISSSLYTNKYTSVEKTTPSMYEDGGSRSTSTLKDGPSFTYAPSTDSTISRDLTHGDVDTLESTTISSPKVSSTTETYFHATSTGSIETEFPNGRSIHDGSVTKESTIYYDQTTKIYPTISSRTKEIVTHITEYTSSR